MTTAHALRKPKRTTPVHYYVEVVSNEQWVGVVTEALGPDQAEANGIEEAQRMYPQVKGFWCYLSRQITPERYDEILRSFSAGSWEGWQFGKRGYS
jgi:hypothetical protein